jgi:hypothetical protein
MIHHSSPGGRRYSARLLWMAITWMKTGPAVYRHLHRLSNAYTLETGLSSSTIAYLQERIKPLTESEKTVELLIDEVSRVTLIVSKIAKYLSLVIYYYQSVIVISFSLAAAVHCLRLSKLFDCFYLLLGYLT